MNEPAATGAAISALAVLVFLLKRARDSRSVDPFEEAKRELSSEGSDYEPIAPGGDPHRSFDKAVDVLDRSFSIFSAIVSALVIGVVVYFCFVDLTTRIVCIVTVILLLAIWFFGRRAGIQ